MIKKHLFVIFFLFISIGLTYLNSFDNEFVWDDEFLIQKNSYLTDFKFIPEILISNSTAGFGGKDNFYRPTQNLMYLLVYQTFGKAPLGFHLANTFVHFLNALLIYFLLIKLFNLPLLAFTTSLLWALHPTHVEAITYISGSADPLSLLFFLCSVLTFPIDSNSYRFKKISLSLFFFGLSILSKESLIVTPAMLCLLIFLKSKDYKSIRSYAYSLPFWFLSLIYLLARQTVLNFDKTFDFYKTTNIYTENIFFRIYTYLATIPEYLKILVFPQNLHMERSFPVHVSFLSTPVTLGFIILTISLLGSVYFLLYKKNRLFVFCWLWFFISFVPMNGILLPVNSFILEHWLYLPSISFFILFGLFFQKISAKNKKLVLIPFTLLCLFFSYLTYERNKDWKTPITFYSNILKYSAGTARVHNNLAMALSDKEMWIDSIKHYEKAIELSDRYPQTHYNLARVYITLQKESLALKHLERSLEISPHFTHSLILKKEVLDFLNKTEKKTD